MKALDGMDSTTSHFLGCFCLFQEHLLLDFTLWYFHSSEMIAYQGRKASKIYSLSSVGAIVFLHSSFYFLIVPRLERGQQYNLTDTTRNWKDYTLFGPLGKLTYSERNLWWLPEKINVLLSFLMAKPFDTIWKRILVYSLGHMNCLRVTTIFINQTHDVWKLY